MAERYSTAKLRVKPIRRIIQLAVLGIIVLVPLGARNPVDWAPSRIVLGQMPEPSIFGFSGDTWSFSIGSFQLSHPLALLDAWVSSGVIYLPLLAAILIPLGLTLVLGRVFCSWLCPVGFLLELNMKIRKALQKLGIGWTFPLADFRYPVLAVCLFMALFLAIPVLSLVDPPHTLGREFMSFFTHHRVSLAGSGLLLGLLLLDTFVSRRACCSKLCPSGGGLSLLGRYRLLRINMHADQCIECGRCDEICPYELDPMNLALDRDFNWTKCDNCGLCRDTCPTGAIEYGYKTAKSKQ
jgi:ferredoxin-type protein NapH